MMRTMPTMDRAALAAFLLCFLGACSSRGGSTMGSGGGGTGGGGTDGGGTGGGACLDLLASCMPGQSCCDGLTCGILPGGGEAGFYNCCVPMGGACTQSAEDHCCGNQGVGALQCGAKGTCCLVTGGSTCATDADCCTGTCAGGTCG